MRRRALPFIAGMTRAPGATAAGVPWRDIGYGQCRAENDARYVRRCVHGYLAAARAVNAKLLSLHQDLFVEANPIPVKWAVSQMGLIGPGLRLPLTQLSDKHHHTVLEAMRDAEVKHLSGWPV